MCDSCKHTFRLTGYNKWRQRITLVHVDHIVPYAKDKDWNNRIKRLFDVDNMQVLCVECHKKKTDKERKNV